MQFILRQWEKSDSEAFAKYANNERIASNMRNSFSFPYTMADAKSYVEGCADSDELRQCCRAVVVEGEAVGSIGIFCMEDIAAKSAEMGYWLAEPFWGMGIMSRAIGQLCAFAFAHYDIVRIYAEPFAHNTGSRRVLEKAGFVLEGIKKKSVYKNGMLCDSCMYALVKEQTVDREIVKYVEEFIIPKYNGFDKAHQIDHAEKVIHNSMAIAKDFEVDLNMVYVIAAYHDIGLEKGREEHERNSGLYLAADPELRRWFDDAQIQLMKEAVEDHRASNKQEPRSIYGKIVAEADRDISYEIILRRTIQYGLSHFAYYSDDEQFERAYAHIAEKYGEGGYLKLWLDSEANLEGLKEVREALRYKEEMRAAFKSIIKPNR